MEKTSSSLVLYDFIRLPLQFYSVVGIKLFQWDETDVVTWRQLCYTLLVTTNLLLNFSCKVSFVIVDKFTNIGKAIEWFLYFMFSINGFCKVVSVLLGRKTLYTVLKDIEKIFPNSRQDRMEFRLAECHSYIMRHAKIMSINHFLIAVMFIVFPLVQSSIEYLNSPDDNRHFVARTPYIFTYPFDASRGMPYAWSYFGQFTSGFTVSFYFVGSDMLLMCTVYLVIMQYAYLCRRIENFESKGYDMDMQELREVLERHNIVNEAANTVNKVFRLSILLNYMISTLILVLIGMQIVTGSETLDLVKFVGFLSASSLQMYYVCRFATELMDASLLVSEAYMGQEWYMTDVRYQRMIVLAVARSQKPSHLTAFKFFKISMESYANLMTTSYQCFTLLKAQMEKNNKIDY